MSVSMVLPLRSRNCCDVLRPSVPSSVDLGSLAICQPQYLSKTQVQLKPSSNAMFPPVPSTSSLSGALSFDEVAECTMLELWRGRHPSAMKLARVCSLCIQGLLDQLRDRLPMFFNWTNLPQRTKDSARMVCAAAHPFLHCPKIINGSLAMSADGFWGWLPYIQSMDVGWTSNATTFELLP